MPTLKFHRQNAALERAIERVLDAVKPWSGEGFRFTDIEFAHPEDLMSGEGSKKFGGRWNPPGLAALYYSMDPQTALLEAFSQRVFYGLRIEIDTPKMVFGVEVDLDFVLDLTDGALRNRLKISHRTIVKNGWKAEQFSGTEGITQAIGRLAYSKNLQGLVVPSAADARGKNLVVFPHDNQKISIMGEDAIERAIKSKEDELITQVFQ
jgi:RES domain-containing protein